jgi:hypothetical protein
MKNERVALRSLAKDVIEAMQERRGGTPIRLLRPSRLRPYVSDTDGWNISIGFLNPGRASLDIWLDRFPGHKDRKLWYGFSSADREAITRIAHYGTGCIGTPFELRDADVEERQRDKGQMRKQMKRRDFGRPFIERYQKAGAFYYGIYDYGGMPARPAQRYRVIERAIEFFETIGRNLPGATKDVEDRQLYPAIENRKIVTMHVRRERSGHLATLRKQLDDYRCQVCDMRFEDFYGPVGRDFAESHHVVPLSKLKGLTRTGINDLITVCANCHRMLHRLTGKAGDVQELRRAVKRRRRRR